jgi:hypothetical protein
VNLTVLVYDLIAMGGGFDRQSCDGMWWAITSAVGALFNDLIELSRILIMDF